jgi:hypoxanthine-guanine phosphoribosyltransferase
MKLIKGLHFNWEYPVIRYSQPLAENIHTIKNFLYDQFYSNQFNIVGIGTSSAMLMGALSHHLADTGDALNPHFTLLRKDNDNTNVGKDFTDILMDKPIIILDDHITNGGTLKEIHYQLGVRNLNLNVQGVIMREYCGDAAIEHIRIHEVLIKGLFTNCQFWFY